MKGVVFCEFVDFVEERFGYDVVDAMIIAADPPSGGVYTAVGRYEFAELAMLIGALSTIVGRPGPDLIFAFGRRLFGRLVETHPHFLEDARDPIDFLESVEGRIHVEVKKLYPDAELPTLTPTRLGANAIALDYGSCRPLGALCLGLIDGCAAFFGVPLDVEAEPREGGLRIVVRRGSRTATSAASSAAMSAASSTLVEV